MAIVAIEIPLSLLRSIISLEEYQRLLEHANKTGAYLESYLHISLMTINFDLENAEIQSALISDIQEVLNNSLIPTELSFKPAEHLFGTIYALPTSEDTGNALTNIYIALKDKIKHTVARYKNSINFVDWPQPHFHVTLFGQFTELFTIQTPTSKGQCIPLNITLHHNNNILHHFTMPNSITTKQQELQQTADQKFAQAKNQHKSQLSSNNFKVILTNYNQAAEIYKQLGQSISCLNCILNAGVLNSQYTELVYGKTIWSSLFKNQPLITDEERNHRIKILDYALEIIDILELELKGKKVQEKDVENRTSVLDEARKFLERSLFFLKEIQKDPAYEKFLKTKNFSGIEQKISNTLAFFVDKDPKQTCSIL